MHKERKIAKIDAMKTLNQTEKPAYRALVLCAKNVCKKRREGVTVADITAKTALPIETVRELLPVCADEFAARLKVTESGEILYSFPNGFSSRYRGLNAALGRFAGKAAAVLKIAAVNLFKVWILVMLVGYFVLFVLLALAALALSVVAQSQSKSSDRRDSGGGIIVVTHLLDLFIRIWFYSELTKSFDPNYRYERRSRPKRRPLYKAVFSFVFGDGDPNAGIEQRENKAVLAYIQAADGVISLPEYMIITGKSPEDAEDSITAFCANYGGSPEATDNGTVVYKFESLMLNTNSRERAPFSAQQKQTLYAGPLRVLETFSSNDKKFNVWFSILNGVNLIFGGYFLFKASFVGAVNTASAESFKLALRESYFYTFVYHIFEQGLQTAALPAIFWGLGFVPFVFSFFFWGIPLLRKAGLANKNEKIKLANLRQAAFDIIWKKPCGIRAEDLVTAGAESRPANLAAAQDKLIKEMAGYTHVEVEQDNNALLYSFEDMPREKNALLSYRAASKNNSGKLGGIVFDSDARV